MRSFKSFLLELSMNQRTYSKVLSDVGSDTKVGFEIEVLVPEHSSFWVDPTDESENEKLAVDIRNFDTMSEFEAYFILGKHERRSIQRDFDDWKEETDNPDADWTDWFKQTQTVESFIRNYELEPWHGWWSDTRVYGATPMKVGFELGWEETAHIMASSLALLVKGQVKIKDTGHAYRNWNLIVDTSILDADGVGMDDGMKGYGIEIVSPKLPVQQALDEIKAIFKWLEHHGVVTNESTGLHINISMPGIEKIDPLKLVLLIGEKHLLSQFNRERSSYARPHLEDAAAGIRVGKPRGLDDLIDTAQKALSKTKNVSVNLGKLKGSDPYLEFRITGGTDYHKRIREIEDIVQRYIAAIDAAIDPRKERQQYIKKLMALASTAGSTTVIEPETLKDAINNDITWDLFKQELAEPDTLLAPHDRRIMLVRLVRNIFFAVGNRSQYVKFVMNHSVKREALQVLRSAGVSAEDVLNSAGNSRDLVLRGLTLLGVASVKKGNTDG